MPADGNSGGGFCDVPAFPADKAVKWRVNRSGVLAGVKSVHVSQMSMNELLPRAERVVALMIARKQTIVVAESAAGGLINAALLAVPGASACCRGGLVVYTYEIRRALLGISDADMKDLTPATEAYALLAARRTREKVGSDWALTETGAAGPTGSRYGYPAGHACFAVAGPVERTRTLETGSADRVANMHIFAAAALELLAEVLVTVPA